MKNKREQALVGLFVLIVAALLIGTVLAVSGSFKGGGVVHHAFFKFAGGLGPGATVRYAGLKAGRVARVYVDPRDSTQIAVEFKIARDIPLKTDSVAKITTLGALDENFLELTAGTNGSPPAAPGSDVNTVEALELADLEDVIGRLAPVVKDVLTNLDGRVSEMRVTLARVNDLLNDQNRANVSSGLGDLKSMLADSRPKLASTLTNVQAASAKMPPLLDSLKISVGKADEALSHVTSILADNQQDVRTSVVELKQTLLTASQTLDAAAKVVDQIKGTLGYNADNIDEIVLNLRHATENLDQMTEAVKRRPSVLIRGYTVKERKPGGG